MGKNASSRYAWFGIADVGFGKLSFSLFQVKETKKGVMGRGL